MQTRLASNSHGSRSLCVSGVGIKLCVTPRSSYFLNYIDLTYSFCVWERGWGGVHVPQCVSGGQRTTWRNESHRRDSWTECKPAGLERAAFPAEPPPARQVRSEWSSYTGDSTLWCVGVIVIFDFILFRAQSLTSEPEERIAQQERS